MPPVCFCFNGAVLRNRSLILPRKLILVFALVGMAMTLPGQTAGVSAFIDFLIDAMQISRVRLSLAYLIGTICSALLLTPAGKVYDRLGSRVVGSAAAAGLGLSLIGLTNAPGIAGILTAAGLSATAATLLVMSVGFFLIRFFGQGVLELVSRTMLLKWFDDKRGLANALFASVTPMVFSMAPIVFNLLISAQGWQGAWRVLGLALMPGGALVALLTFSDPERSGGSQLPAISGARPSSVVAAAVPPLLAPLASIARCLGLRRTSEPPRPLQDRPLAYAVTRLAFWVFLMVNTASAALLTGLTFHVVGVFAEAGIGRAAALALFFPASLVAVVLLSIASIISDYIRLKYFAVAHALSLTMTLLCIPFLSEGPVAYAMLVFWKGFSMAMFGVNQAVVWPRFFGLRHLGEIAGFAAACMVAGSALGPYAFSLAVDISGSFHAVAWIAAPLCAVIALLGFRADNPNRAPATPDVSQGSR